MKYKVGDEVLVRAKIIEADDKAAVVPYKIARTDIERKTLNSMVVNESDIVPADGMTAEEAWEIAKKIADMLCEESNEIFGTAHLEHILQRNTPQEAKAKIEAWEAEKEIKVGDEVDHYGEIGVVTNTDDKAGFFNVLFKNGKTAAYKSERLKKTGRHIDIELLLNKIGGE